MNNSVSIILQSYSGPTYCTLAPSRQRYPFNHQTVTLTDAATPSPLDDPDIVYSAPLMMDFAVLSSSAQFGRLSVLVVQSICRSVRRAGSSWPPTQSSSHQVASYGLVWLAYSRSLYQDNRSARHVLAGRLPMPVSRYLFNLLIASGLLPSLAPTPPIHLALSD